MTKIHRIEIAIVHSDWEESKNSEGIILRSKEDAIREIKENIDEFARKISDKGVFSVVMGYK